MGPAMTYEGHVEKGAVVLDQPVPLPDGSRIECVVYPRDSQNEAGKADHPYRSLMKFAGQVTDLPEDASVNVDHYLYGCRKR